MEGNDEWFADFRTKNPDKIIGLSEYGADANPQFQSEHPERSDYTESYQTVYHEHLLNFFAKSPYLWATHVWNMFDFAADGRDEGGKHGVNQKGLVTFDRKTKKDAYFAYKAHWSKEAFVHLCGSRFIERVDDVTNVKVYSNLDSVELYCDGTFVGCQEGSHVFQFQVPISGEHFIEAKSGGCIDSMRIKKISTPNPSYTLTGGTVVNWFDKDDITALDGYFSIKDSLLDIKKCPEGAALVEVVKEKAKSKRGDVAKDVQIPVAMQRMMDAMPLEKLLQQAGDAVSSAEFLALNQELNKIPKP